jgi:hypothetical protein
VNSGNDGDLPLASEPEELSGDQPPLTQLKRIIFVAVALLAVASVIVVQSWRQTRNESKNGATPSSGSSTNQGHASPSMDRQSALTVGTGYELNADSGTRVAAYSFLIRWTGDDPLEVRYDGTGLPPGLRYVPGRSGGASILLRRGQTVTLTLDFRITDCQHVSAGMWPLRLGTRLNESAPWQYVLVIPPVPAPASRWQLLIRNAVCQAGPSSVSTSR